MVRAACDTAGEMFILYAIPIGIVAGYLLGGRLERLGGIRVRWAPLALAGLAIQVALFTDPLAPVVGDAGPPIYIASTALVLVAVLRNLDIAGVAVIAIGASSNLLAIVANGGYMPADPAALASIGGIDPGYSNSQCRRPSRPRPADRSLRHPGLGASLERLQHRRRADRRRRGRDHRHRHAQRDRHAPRQRVPTRRPG